VVLGGFLGAEVFVAGGWTRAVLVGARSVAVLVVRSWLSLFGRVCDRCSPAS
jgi:hypothetical protein